MELNGFIDWANSVQLIHNKNESTKSSKHVVAGILIWTTKTAAATISNVLWGGKGCVANPVSGALIVMTKCGKTLIKLLVSITSNKP